MNLREKILAAAFGRIADFAGDVRDALSGADPDTAEHEPGDDCCEAHRRHPDAASVAGRTWRGAFASDVREGALIALDGRHFGGPRGRRALRITDRRDGDRAGLGLFGAAMETITFLFVDLDTERSDSITVAPQTALDVAVEVPDSVPADMGGES